MQTSDRTSTLRYTAISCPVEYKTSSHTGAKFYYAELYVIKPVFYRGYDILSVTLR